MQLVRVIVCIDVCEFGLTSGLDYGTPRYLCIPFRRIVRRFCYVLGEI